MFDLSEPTFIDTVILDLQLRWQNYSFKIAIVLREKRSVQKNENLVLTSRIKDFP